MKFIKSTVAAFGTSAVIAGAFGAHALRERLTATGKMDPWQTAVLYHLIHAVALLAIAIHTENAAGTDVNQPGRWRLVCIFWIAGTTLFSGSLYWLALGGPRWLGPITPIGGVMLIVGWFLVAFVKPRPHP